MHKRPLSKDALAILAKVKRQNVRSVMLNAVEKALLELRNNSFQALAEAICACPDEELREMMGDAMRAAMNLLRFGLTPQRREALSGCAHLIVTVPFTMSGAGKIDSLDALRVLLSRIDEKMDMLRDPNGAKLPGLVLAVPNRSTTPADLVSLNFMLSNPERSDADNEYFTWWAQAGATTVLAHQDAVDPEWHTRQAFFYAFAMAVPQMSAREAVDGPLILTEYGQQVLDVIMTSVAEVNRNEPNLHVDLLEVRKLSDGIACTQRIAIHKTLETLHASIGTQSTEVTEPDPLSRVVTGMDIIRFPAAAQLLEMQFVGESGAMLAASRLLLPAGFPKHLAEQEIDAFTAKVGVECIKLPLATLEQYRCNALGMPFVRSADGHWQDPSLLKVGPKATTILQTGEWAIGWDARILNADNPTFVAQLKVLPDPVRQARGGIDNVLREHYTPGFLKHFKEVVARPGLSREAAAVALQEEFGYPLVEMLKQGHGRQLLPCQQMYCATHFTAAGGAMFMVRERLMNALAETDLSDDYPTEALRIPFPDCYFHFEKPISIDPANSDSPLHIDGFYVSEEIDPADEEFPEERRYTIVPIAEDAEQTFDLTSEALLITCSPGDGKNLGMSFSAIDETVREHGVDPRTQAVADLLKEFLRTMVKVLLYTTLHDQRRREVNDRTAAMAAAREKQGKERQKAMDRAGKLYDYISIGPESDIDDDSGLASTAVSKNSHVRRGSYVWQAWGPNHSLRRNQWRRPTIVNRDSGNDPSKKTYIVG